MKYIAIFLLLICCPLAGSQVAQSPKQRLNRRDNAKKAYAPQYVVVDGKEIPANQIQIHKQQPAEEPAESLTGKLCCAAMFYGTLYCIQTCTKIKVD